MSRGAIRDIAKFANAALRRRTERFDSCFPRGISLGDIDSFVEINNHFMFLEWKVSNQEIPTGQQIALSLLAKQPRTTVWVIWTTEDQPGVITHVRSLGRDSRRVKITEEQLHKRMCEWVAMAEGRQAANDNAKAGR